MPKFLQSRAGSVAEDEILGQNVLTCAYLRSLIPGDFHLELWGDLFLLLHEKGIFVMKQYHCNGIIEGSENAESWVDRNYLGDGTAFPNPLTQLQGHIAMLSRLLKLPQTAFHSVVLFDAQCELRQVPKNKEAFSVLRVDQLEDFFAAFPRLPLCYDHGQVEALRDIFLLVSAV